VNAFLEYDILAFGFIAILGLWSLVRLRKRNLILKQMLRKRTRALKQEQQKLIESSQLKQDFLANMSHEILNPLNGILGITRLMRDDIAETEQTAKRVKQLYSCANHLSQLLRQTLDCASLESTQISARQMPFFAPELLNEVLDMHRCLAAEKGLQVELQLTEVVHEWIGDRVLLRQILINLVSNAVKYTTSGHVTIALSYCTENTTVRAKFVVTDSGPGIPNDKQRYIFEKFTRLSEPGEKQVFGTGLGLAIAAEIARLLNGSLELDPRHESGARFSLKLPLTLGQPMTRPTKQTAPRCHGPQKRPKVLIADDMDFNREIIRQVLEEQEAEVIEANDGTQALDALKKIDFDLVLLDINMPNSDGIDVVKTALSSQGTCAPTFVAVTAHANPTIEARCLQAGFDHFIQKPLNFKTIKALLNHARPVENKATANANDSLLNYLARKNGSSATKLQARYRAALSTELDHLLSALQGSHPRATHESLHKLQSLAYLRKDPVVLDLLKSISTAVSTDEPSEPLIGFCDQLKGYIEETDSETLVTGRDCQR
jgi:signal transduction histidine kinase/CheY-like chemotaxis protein